MIKSYRFLSDEYGAKSCMLELDKFKVAATGVVGMRRGKFNRLDAR